MGYTKTGLFSVVGRMVGAVVGGAVGAAVGMPLVPLLGELGVGLMAATAVTGAAVGQFSGAGKLAKAVDKRITETSFKTGMMSVFGSSVGGLFGSLLGGAVQIALAGGDLLSGGTGAIAGAVLGSIIGAGQGIKHGAVEYKDSPEMMQRVHQTPAAQRRDYAHGRA